MIIVYVRDMRMETEDAIFFLWVFEILFESILSCIFNILFATICVLSCISQIGRRVKGTLHITDGWKLRLSMRYKRLDV